MSPEEIEKKIADLEQSNLDAQQSVAGMVELNRALIDFQKTVATHLFKWMVSLDNRNGEALQLMKEALPNDADRRKLGDILARSVFDRDQLEAMIKKVESLPPTNPPDPNSPPGS